MLRFVLKCKQQRLAENVFDFVRKASYKVNIRLDGQNCEWVCQTLLARIVNGSVGPVWKIVKSRL